MREIPHFFQFGSHDTIEFSSTKTGTSDSQKKDVPFGEIWILEMGRVRVTGANLTQVGAFIFEKSVSRQFQLVEKTNPTSEDDYVFPTTQAGDRNVCSPFLILTYGDQIGHEATRSDSGQLDVLSYWRIWRFPTKGRF